MSTPQARGSVEDDLMKASRDASAFFERFDKSSLQDAAVRRSTDWLLSEEASVLDSSDFFMPMIKGMKLSPGEVKIKENKSIEKTEKRGPSGHTLLIPWPKHLAGYKPLYIQDIHQITRELIEGIFVFNQIPSISFESNHDNSTTCIIPSAYQDTLIGDTMLSTDYYIKSLLHGTTFGGKDKRRKVLEEWQKIPERKIKQRYAELGLTLVSEDKELGGNIYLDKKQPFVRYPQKFLDRGLGLSQLQPRLSTSEYHRQQLDHLGRDMFLRHLGNVRIGLVFGQKSIQQYGNFIILEPSIDVTTGVLATLRESDSELYSHLHSYLQKQREFIADHLQAKQEVAYCIQLLGFVSFMIPFLISLKKQNKIVKVSDLLPPLSKDLLRTDRDLAPVLPSEDSRWTPYTGKNAHTAVHGEIHFQLMPLTMAPPSLSEAELSKLDSSLCSSSTEELTSCDLGGDKYYCFSVSTERFYLQTPKQPRWVHAMVAELKTQAARQPAVTESRVNDLLRKIVGTRQLSSVKNINILLQLSIERGLLSAVNSLLKRCTQTRLNKTDEVGMSLLHYAAVNAHGHVISVLALGGCSVSQPVGESSPHPTDTLPIHLACQSGGLDAVCCLQHYGVDLAARDGNGWAPIHYAAFHNYQPIIAHLVSVDESFLELTTGDKAKSTPLLLAAQNGCYDAFKKLIDLGAALKVTNHSNQTPVHMAVLHHHLDIVRYLIQIKCIDTECVIWEAFVEMLTSNSTEQPNAVARILDDLTRTLPHQVELIMKHKIIPLLVQLLKREESTQLAAIQVIANLSNLAIIKGALLKVNAIPSIVSLLQSKSDRMQACVCLVLSDLAMSLDCQVTIAKAGALPHLVKLLQSPEDDVRTYACACVGILCIGQSSNQNAVAELSAIPSLILLLQSNQSCLQACAAGTIRSLVKDNLANQLATLSEGGVAHLVPLLRSRDPPVHNSVAEAIEALAERCTQAQKELLEHAMCIDLLKRLLMMRNPTVKVCGGCALWAIAGELISDKRSIAAHIGLALLVDMLTVNNERLNYVCSEALGALASELGDYQIQILRVGGVKPLLDVLSSPSSQKVCLSVIHTLAALCMKPALVPSVEMQKRIGSARGVSILAAIVSSHQASDIVRVEAACALAKLVLNNRDNDAILARHKEFTYLTVYKFLTSSDSSVRLLSGYCLSVMAFNNPRKLERLKAIGTLHVSNFLPFLESEEEFHQVHAAFQVVVLSRLLIGVRSVDIAVKGLRLLIELLNSEVESIKVQSAEFIASLAHSGDGIPDTLVMAGVLEGLMANLASGTGPVIESCSVALGYFTFNPLAARLITRLFRDTPELYCTFKKHFGTIVVSQKFLSNWCYVEYIGLPALSLTIRGGPSVTTGRRVGPTASDLPPPDRQESKEPKNQALTFGNDRKTHKTMNDDKRLTVGFLVTRKNSLPLVPGRCEGVLPKRHTSGGNPGVKSKKRSDARTKTLAVPSITISHR